MSERYTPEHLRDEAMAFDQLSQETAEMLRQAATDAEALAAKDKAIARLTESRNEIITRNAEMFKELRQAWPALGRCVQQKEALQDSLTAERQKIRELREWLAFTDFPTGFRVMGKTLPDQHHSDCSCREGMLCDCAALTAAIEARKDVITKLDALGLTGDATEGQG